MILKAHHCLALFLLLCICFSRPAAASPSAQTPPDEIELCLGCHGEKSLSADLKDGTKLRLHIDADTIRKSVHRTLRCSSCHQEFSADKHPSRILKNKREHTLAGSALCKNCHTRFKSSLHARMADTAKRGGKVCVDCHGSHDIQPISKEGYKNSEYCLGCHRNEMYLYFKDGQKQSAQIMPDILKTSVHSKLYCTDCHFGFSPEEHPQRSFRSSRDYTIVVSESCRRCHFDKYTKTLESIHYTMLSQGNLNAPVCVDCHGSHAIAQTGKERTASAKRCEKCHGDIYAIYAKSIHGSALFHEHNQDVPVCADCHRAHNIIDPRTFDYREKIPQMCGNCHANRELMNKYGLSTAVINSYLQDFHGVTLKLYTKQKGVTEKLTTKPIAVCIDCHGIHDITATTGPNASVVKDKLVKRCQKCHPDAGENFPDSWISHYKPSLKKAPLVYLINITYKVFIPFMMVGLILQILLHIWRYSVNR